MNAPPQADAAVGFDESWYRQSAQRPPPSPPLEGSIDTDVCIIGGGYTGLSAALELASAGIDAVLLEAHEVGAGASGRNGGVLGVGYNIDQLELEERFGKVRARALWDLSLAANDLVRQRIAAQDIDCELTDGELTVAHRPSRLGPLEAAAEHLTRAYDFAPLTLLSAQQVAARLGTAAFHGGVLNGRSAHLHPLKLAYGELAALLRTGVRVYEQTRVHRLRRQSATAGEGIEVATATGRVRARKVILACNGYLDGLVPALDRLQMPINNFIAATEPLSEATALEINRHNEAVVDTRFVVNYFHLSRDRRLIYGGGETYRARYPRNIEAVVRPHLARTYPQLAAIPLTHAWGGTLSISLNRLPQLGTLDGRIYWAQAYSGHGVALAHLGGQLCARAVQGESPSFASLADLPQRAFPGGRWLRWPALVAGLLYYSLLDRL